jgi:uncharacterized protein (TIGR03083 family)
MEPAAYIDHIRDDGTALVGAARKGPDAPVPTCPEWDVTALVVHIGRIHRWAGDTVATRAFEPVRRQTPPEDGTEPETVFAWYEDGLQHLLDALGAADPEDQVWNFRDGAPGPARFWHRRMAQETVIHRWDAENAVGAASPLDTALAVDGIDEFLSLLPGRFERSPVPGLSGSLHLHSTDAEGEWWLRLAPDHIEQRREHAKADAAIRGPASALFLWVVNRLPADAPELAGFGDPAVIEAWKTVRF